jgi:hypothetical protein
MNKRDARFNLIKIFGMTVLLLFTSGCSVLASKTQSVKIACSESDATLQINGGETFTGKTQIEARRNKTVAAACFKPGYFTAQKYISSSLSTTGMYDLAGSFIFVLPAIGLFTPGAWSLDETDVTLTMVKYQDKHE